MLARPGSSENEKSYQEPGGSFSPKPGSFGVSFWFHTPYGGLETSDGIPLSDIGQRLEMNRGPGAGDAAAVVTDTSYYNARWSLAGQDQWTLMLQQIHAAEISVVIRSVGPAGAPIRKLDWNGTRLRINERWDVTTEPRPDRIILGDEREPGWTTTSVASQHWNGADGWGFARFVFAGGNAINVRIHDTGSTAAKPYLYPVETNALRVSLPDPRFAQSIETQVGHLMMSLVGNETRSADPVNTPVPWQRTGAYIIAALARAGQSQTAKELSRYLAENDFYGGFGAEADAPGLAIWSLRQVATQLNDPDYDKWLWVHVRRKADLIVQMLWTKAQIRRTSPTPIVPRESHNPDNDLLAEPARDGLIVGRMDYHRPVLYVNAVSYRGLLDAAWLADRVGERSLAEFWRERARRLQADWMRAFTASTRDDDRTYMSALWPTWIAADVRSDLQHKLSQRWEERRNGAEYRQIPLWTYFELAEAHQWLFLNDFRRTWTTLRWFWEHQVSPGLFTWWEGKDEGNAYGGWTQIRGWVKPPYVTPHYWTNAEMLLLQLDMLAYVDESAADPVLVIGAGIPAEWTTTTMSVRGVGTSLGTIGWDWAGGEMSVVIRGGSARNVNVRLGGGLPSFATVHVEYR